VSSPPFVPVEPLAYNERRQKFLKLMETILDTLS
jgi:hypothetical protein